MPLVGYLVDTNLLLLFIVGSESPDLISKHRRLESYSEEDYSTLHSLLNRAGGVFVTPNTLTEASNLLGQHGEPERSRLFQRLRAIIQDTHEVVVSSVRASAHPAFDRLGLTDTVLLEAASADIPLLTLDFQLYSAGLAKGDNMAVNFMEHRHHLST